MGLASGGRQTALEQHLQVQPSVQCAVTPVVKWITQWNAARAMGQFASTTSNQITAQSRECIVDSVGEFPQPMGNKQPPGCVTTQLLHKIHFLLFARPGEQGCEHTMIVDLANGSLFHIISQERKQ